MAMSPASFPLAGDCAFGNAERRRGEYVEACPEDLEPCMSLRADRAFRGFRRFGRRRRTDFQPTHPNRERVADGLFQLSKLMALPIVAKRRNGRQNVLRLASGRARLSK